MISALDILLAEWDEGTTMPGAFPELFGKDGEKGRKKVEAPAPSKKKSNKSAKDGGEDGDPE